MARHKLRAVFVLLIALAVAVAGLAAVVRTEDEKTDRFLRLEEEVETEHQCSLPNATASYTFTAADDDADVSVSLAPDQPSCGYERYGVGLYGATIVVQMVVLGVNLATVYRDARPQEQNSKLRWVPLAVTIACILCATAGFALLDRLAYDSFAGDNLYVWDVHHNHNSNSSNSIIIHNDVITTNNNNVSFSSSHWTRAPATSTLSYSVLATTAESAVASDEMCYRFHHQEILDQCVQALYDTYDCLDRYYGAYDHYCRLEHGCEVFFTKEYYHCGSENKYQFLACVEEAIQLVEASPPDNLAVPFFDRLLTGWSPTVTYIAANLFRLFLATFQWRGWARVLTRDYMRTAFTAESDRTTPHDQILCAVPRCHAPLQSWLGLMLQDAVAYGLLVIVLQISMSQHCLRIVSPMTHLNSFAAVYFPTCTALFLVATFAPLFVACPAVFVGLVLLLAVVAFVWGLGIGSSAVAQLDTPEGTMLRASLLCMVVSIFCLPGVRASWYVLQECRRRTKEAQQEENDEGEELDMNESTVFPPAPEEEEAHV